ncbi:unnamed protein product (macronuclear) [Paramecium tetraurelia]|uniref:Arrestin C-terminal-like domain-containing protein n=1 Tax=Paramecium tetraurelia TaxID=5888 RepID=A0BIT0_PARTE|nr:uncharacterized protein GSPATT00004819001 [Paramecium tetraurelia]CAK58447.1 unnamed protein product [Paramecium tetraurelia]|eukprot:XP_001425845.1 hypothetical protein (macronuclear) [Paramecium tetraurelia strain d4-2]
MVFILTLEQAQISIKTDKPMYYPGEVIRGVIYLKVKTKDINAGTLYLKLCGQEKVNQLDKHNQFFSFKQFIFKKQKKITDFGKKMPLIACRKYFEMEVPNLSPSFTINYYKMVQCRILYFLSVTIQSEDEKYLYKPPKKHRVVIHILQKPQIHAHLSLEHSGESKVSNRCCFSTGSTKVKVQLNKPYYTFGENIDIILQVDNSQSSSAIQNFKFQITSQLVILYKQQKRKLSNYFDLFDQELNFAAGEQKEVKTILSLPNGKPTKASAIFPQSSLKTKRIIFQYILTLKVIFAKRLLLSQQDLTVPIPLYLIQNQKREKDNVFQSMDNISIAGSIFDTNQKINASVIKKFIYGDHNCSGYGEQDGYSGPERKYNPFESLNENALKDVKGALEQLMFQKQYENEDSDDDDKLIEEIDGVNLNNVSINVEQSEKQEKPKTIFQLGKKNDISLPNHNIEEAKLDNGIQDQLQTIKEEVDSKGTQYNLNNALSSSCVRKNHHEEENDDQQNKQFQQQSYPIDTFGSFQKVIINKEECDQIKIGSDEQENQIKPINLKQNRSLSNSIDQTDQKEQKQFKVQFNDVTSVDTLDGKTGERQSTQCRKNENQSKQF